MSARRLAILGFAALALAGCGGGSHSAKGQTAAAFVEQVTRQFSLGQAGPLWDELVPAEQRIVSRARFVDCQRNEGFVLKSVKVLDSYDEPVDVDGRTDPSTAVSVRVSATDGVTTATLHAVRVGGGWRWILQPSQLAAYRRGVCPGG